MSEISAPIPITRVRRVHRAGGDSQAVAETPLRAGFWQGFGAIPGETAEEFHERMFDLDPLVAMAYEMEFSLEHSG